MYDLRTKPMNEALVRNECVEKVSLDRTGVTFVDYQPGNGTAYKFFLTRVEGSSSFGRWLGFGESSGWIVSWVPDQSQSFRNIHIVANGYFLDPYFVQSKLGCGISDAVVLAEVFAHLMGRSAMTSEEFERLALEKAG
jgi:hypothetical protein